MKNNLNEYVSYHECEPPMKNVVNTPRNVALIGDRDTWAFKYGDDSKFFHLIWQAAGEPGPCDEWWIETEKDLTIDSMVKHDGPVLFNFQSNARKASCDKWSYETIFEGYKILVANTVEFTSEFFGELINDYPFVAVYCHSGKMFKISLYSVNMDIVDIAQKYGGGGHARACGFTTKEIPFRRHYDELIGVDEANEEDKDKCRKNGKECCGKHH